MSDRSRHIRDTETAGPRHLRERARRETRVVIVRVLEVFRMSKISTPLLLDSEKSTSEGFEFSKKPSRRIEKATCLSRPPLLQLKRSRIVNELRLINSMLQFLLQRVLGTYTSRLFFQL